MDITYSMSNIKEKFTRFIQNKYSFNDYLSISSHFKNKSEGEVLSNLMADDWSETKATGENSEKLNRVLDKLHHKISLSKSETSNTTHSYFQVFSRIAAVLILPALITIAVLGYLSIEKATSVDSWVEIHSPVGSRTEFMLPDGTSGWLNSGASLKYPINFNRNRSVELNGEAWFDVVHKRSNAFYVLTNDFNVKVLGTKFNVVCYDDEQTAEVILEDGKVEVLDKRYKKVSEMNPDQQFVYDKTLNKRSKRKIDAKAYTSWKDGTLIFKNEPMSEIARRLERKYNVEIVLHGETLKNEIFRATFQDETLDEICKMISTVAPIQYMINKREKQADDTFAKRRVEMWLN